MKTWRQTIRERLRGDQRWSGLLCLLLAAAIFGVVNLPRAVGASAAVRQLPIYCVQRDQKVVSISFDAAWGNAK